MLPQASADHYAEQQRMTLLALAEVRRLWGRTPPREFDSWFNRNIELLIGLIELAQTRMIAGADEYVAAVLEELGTPVAADVVIAPEALVGIASDGRALDGLLYGSILTAKHAVAEGSTPAEAWAAAGSQALMMIHTQLADTSRAATGLGITARRNVGYVRMVSQPACSRCVLLAGRFYRKAGFARHPNCFPAGISVGGPSAEAATRRWFEGELVVLATASGQELSLTGNHPILTSRGWVPANLLQEGDEVVRSTRPQGATPLVVPDHHQVPALIEDVWSAFSVRGLHRVPTTAEDFHGDGQRGEVDIVYPDGALRRRGHTSLPEHGVQNLLALRGELPFLLGTQGASEFVDVRNSPAADGAIGGRSLTLPLIGAHGGGADLSSLAVATGSDAGTQETPADHLAGHSVLTGEGVLAGSGFVGGCDRLAGEFGLPRWDAPALPFSVESRSGYASRGKQLLDRLSGQVELDRVVVLRRVEWRGHVYSLTSSEGWHTANSLIVSNCDCRHIPAREDRAGDLTTDPRQYFNSLTEEQQNRTFTTIGAQAIRDGADMGQVVNARRGMGVAGGVAQRRNVYGRQLLTTTEGVTRRGIAGRRIRARGRNPRTTPRLMPEAIYEIGEDREDILRLLRLNSFII